MSSCSPGNSPTSSRASRRSRCARGTSGAARCPRPGRRGRGLGGRTGHRGHHARLRPLLPVRVRAAPRVRGPQRDRHHWMAGRPGREAARPGRPPVPAARRRGRPAGALVEPGGNAWRAVAAAHAGPGKRLLVWGPGSIGLLATAFAPAPRARRCTWPASTRSARRWPSASARRAASPPRTRRRACCRRGHRLHQRRDGSRRSRLAVRRAGQPGSFTSGWSRRPSLVDSREIVAGTTSRVVGILGASAGLAPAIEHYADGRVDPRPLAQVLVGLDRAADALAGQLDTGAGTKIHISCSWR